MNSSWDLRHRHRFEEGDMENIVDTRVCREVKSIGHRIDFLQDWIRPQVFEVKFVRGAGSLDMSWKEPNTITNFILCGLEDFLVVEASMVFLS